MIKFIHQSSCIPKEWISKNNYLHEVALWYDGTAMHVHHTISVNLLVLQFLEVSVHYGHQLHIYHTIAAFPDKAVKSDIMEII